MTKGDRWLLLIMITVGLSLLAWRTWSFPSSHRQVRVFRDGDLILSFVLQEKMTRTDQVEVDGGVATLEVKDGAVRLAPESAHSCPRRVCVRTGWIKQPGESIICAPNKLVIRIESMEAEIDAISR
ncbi:MAG: NusG domain II-containing protein [Firmicutes bacterium]|nr:NusG domain II-containing protein [Bacillota bacterium]